MNPDVKESEMPIMDSPEFAEPSLPPAEGTTDQILLPPPSENQSGQEVMERIKAVFSSLPEYISEFFSEYSRPLITLGLIFAGVVTVKLTLAMLDALDDIPLLSPTFKLIGFGYSVWFVYRYLLRASNRQELSKDFEEWKNQIVGQFPK